MGGKEGFIKAVMPDSPQPPPATARPARKAGKTLPTTIIPARKQVFMTYEIMERILTYLPPEEILEVGKAFPYWEQVIEDDSPAMKRAQCVDPAEEESKVAVLPVYESALNMVAHPAFTLGQKQGNAWIKRTAFRIDEDAHFDIDPLEFVTFPRCSSVLMYVEATAKFDPQVTASRYTYVPCVVHNDNGVRVEDVLEVRDEVIDGVSNRSGVEKVLENKDPNKGLDGRVWCTVFKDGAKFATVFADGYSIHGITQRLSTHFRQIETSAYMVIQKRSEMAMQKNWLPKDNP